MKRKVISVFLAGIMLLGFTTTVMADSLQDLQDQASDINATIKEQESRRDEIKEERATALDEIESIENSIGKYEVEIENLESEISSLESDIEKKKEWVSPLLISKVKQFFWRNAQHLAQFENHIKGNTDIA